MKTFVLTLAGLLILSLSAFGGPETATSSAKVVDLRVERMVDPETVNHPLPRFGWRIETEEPGYLQTSYRILAASSAELLAQDKSDLWDSEEKPGRRSQFISYGGPPLTTGQVVHWKVQSKNRAGRFTSWSEPASFTVKLNGPPALPSPLFLPITEAPRLSSFECSDPNLNKIYDLAAERLHEITSVRDIGLTMQAAAFHQEIHPRASAWLHHMHASIDAAGFYPATLPSDGTYGSTQSDAAISANHALWWVSGDTANLRRHWTALMNYSKARQGVDPNLAGAAFGKLPADTLPESDPTDDSFVHLGSMSLNVRLMIEMAREGSQSPYELTGLQKDLATIQNRLEAACLKPQGPLMTSTTALLIAIRSGAFSKKDKEAAFRTAFSDQVKGKEPKSLLRESPFTTTSLLQVLTQTGHLERGFEVSDHNPDALSPQELLAISNWLVSMVGGIGNQEPGFHTLQIKPYIPSKETLSFAKTTYHSLVGEITTNWFYEGDKLRFDLTVPPNTVAHVILPARSDQKITENGESISSSKNVFSLKRSKTSASFYAPSGSFHLMID